MNQEQDTATGTKRVKSATTSRPRTGKRKTTKPGQTSRRTSTRTSPSARKGKGTPRKAARKTKGTRGRGPVRTRRTVSRPKKPGAPTRIKQRQKTTVSSTPPDLKWVEEDPRDHLLSRFIHDMKGKVIGESIGVEGKQLIMKSGSKFYAVPLRNIKEGETELILRGRIDKRQARKLGEVWRKKALDPLYQKKK